MERSNGQSETKHSISNSQEKYTRLFFIAAEYAFFQRHFMFLVTGIHVHGENGLANRESMWNPSQE
jgi:hypothetical protein